MKKTMALSIAVLLACLMLAGCGGDKAAGADAKGGVAGTTWVLDSIEVAGQKVSGADMTTIVGEITYQFKDGGELTATVAGVEGTGTYSENGNKISIDDGTQSVEATIDGDTMTFDIEGMKMVFVKK